jgi:hypothetical protein
VGQVDNACVSPEHKQREDYDEGKQVELQLPGSAWQQTIAGIDVYLIKGWMQHESTAPHKPQATILLKCNPLVQYLQQSPEIE